MSSRHDDTLFKRLDRFNRLYRQCLITRLSPYGVQPAQVEILRHLWEEDGLTQKELLANMDIEQPTMAKTLKRMERDGLISRKPNPQDRRIVPIKLTGKGQDLQVVVDAAMKDLREVAFHKLNFNDIRYFQRILKQMGERLEDDLDDPILVLADEIE